MLKYAVLLLDDSSVSYCSYEAFSTGVAISNQSLKSAILWCMKENLEIQFVFPNHKLDKETIDLVESVSHTKIMGTGCPYLQCADIIIIDGIEDLSHIALISNGSYIVRLDYPELADAIDILTQKKACPNRINFVIKNRPYFSDTDIGEYEKSLLMLSNYILKMGIETNKLIQSNLLTDRLFLNSMNNCGAGDECITIAPNGRFYICPAFYYEKANDCGSPSTELRILNKELYQLDHAPICRHCDAFQCTRCIWMNKYSTLEVNTPSQGQCYSSHIERNVSIRLLGLLKENNLYVEGMVSGIVPLHYIDPFDNRNNWN